MEKFFNMTYRLRNVYRWNTSYCNLKESVAEHCYYVALISELLYEIDLKNGDLKLDDISLSDLLLCALYHDAFESYSSHIVSPVKNISLCAKKGIESIKNIFKDRLMSTIIEDDEDKLLVLRQVFVNIDKRVIRYIELADCIEAYIFSEFEVFSGNKDFTQKRDLMEDRIKILSRDNKCVKIFFDTYFDKNFEIQY